MTRTARLLLLLLVASIFTATAAITANPDARLEAELIAYESTALHWLKWVAFAGLTITTVLTVWVCVLRQAVRKRTALLEEKEANLRAIFDASPDAIWVSDRAGNVVEHNAQLTSYVTDAAKPIRGRAIGTMFSAEHEHTSRVQEIHNALITSGVPANLLVSTFDQQGNPRQLEVSKVALPNKTGHPAGVLSVARDITDRLQTEQRLRVWVKAFQQAAVGIAIFDARNYKILAVNAAFAKDRDYEPAEMEGQSPDILYPPDLIEKRAAIRKAQDKLKAHWTAETEHITRTGRRFPVRIDVTVYHDTDGAPINSLVFATDITEQKQAEQERAIAAVSFDTSDAMLITDAQRIIQKANHAFCELMGYSGAELIGKSTNILRTDHHEEDFYHGLWEEVARKGLWKGQRWVAMKTGLPHVMRMTISAVKNDVGEVTHYVYSMSDIAHEKDVQANIEKLTFYDALTGLPNLAFLRGRLSHHLSEHGTGVLLMLDIDRFKQINDVYDHAMGDRIIAELGRRLGQTFGDDAVVCRFGGGTFVVMLYVSAGRDKDVEEIASQAITQIHQVARRPFDAAQDNTISLTVSIGWTPILPTDTVHGVLKEADLALYSAKALGRDTACRYQQVMQEELERREMIVRDLRSSLTREDFILYLQVQVDQAANVTGAEVLLRWRDANQEMVSPAEFIPIAEQSGLIIPIGTFVLKSSCQLLMEWAKHDELSKLTLAVNVSAKQLASPHFVGMVQELLAAYPIDAKKLKLEITESAIVEDLQLAIGKLSALRALGIQISMDDFGTGYSSLSCLAKLPLDQVKIAQSFVRMLGFDHSHTTIIDAIIAMGLGLKLDVIAEGVETHEQLEFLTAKKCTAFQGYLFAKPMPIRAFEMLVTSREAQG